MLKRLTAKARMTPAAGSGFNLVGVDTYASDVEDELYLVGTFVTRAEAEDAKAARLKKDPDERLYIFGSE